MGSKTGRIQILAIKLLLLYCESELFHNKILLRQQAVSQPLQILWSQERIGSSVQSLGHVQLFATPWTAAHQASLSITNSRSLLKLMSIQLVMPSNHFILCPPLLLPPSTFPSIRVFSNESVLCIMWPKYWSFSFSISPSNEYSGLISFRKSVGSLSNYPTDRKSVGCISLQSKGLSRVFSKITVEKHQFFGTQLSLWSSSPYMTTGKTIVLTFVGKVMSLLLNMLSRFVIAFVPRSKHLLISWLQSSSATRCFLWSPKK